MLSVGGGYFSGFSLHSALGLSSDDVALYKLLPRREDLVERFGVVFLPTVTDSAAERARKARLHLVYYRSPDDYLALTRPLSASIEDVVSLAKLLREAPRPPRVFASLASERLSGFEELMRKFRGVVDGYEVEIGLMFHLYGRRRGFESFALDLLEELVRRAERPLVAKLSPGVPMSDDFLKLVSETGVAGLVFSPHVLYSIGDEVFRAHSPLLSKVFSHAWARLSASLNLSTAYVTDAPVSSLDELDLARAFDILLVDTAALLELVRVPAGSGAAMPLRWSEASLDSYPAIDPAEGDCAASCPFAAFGEQREGLLVAGESCDMCGLCLTVCRSARMIRVIAPE